MPTNIKKSQSMSKLYSKTGHLPVKVRCLTATRNLPSPTKPSVLFFFVLLQVSTSCFFILLVDDVVGIVRIIILFLQATSSSHCGEYLDRSLLEHDVMCFDISIPLCNASHLASLYKFHLCFCEMIRLTLTTDQSLFCTREIS
jgi:hypothetical protein